MEEIYLICEGSRKARSVAEAIYTCQLVCLLFCSADLCCTCSTSVRAPYEDHFDWVCSDLRTDVYHMTFMTYHIQYGKGYDMVYDVGYMACGELHVCIWHMMYVFDI